MFLSSRLSLVSVAVIGALVKSTGSYVVAMAAQLHGIRVETLNHVRIVKAPCKVVGSSAKPPSCKGKSGGLTVGMATSLRTLESRH